METLTSKVDKKRDHFFFNFFKSKQRNGERESNDNQFFIIYVYILIRENTKMMVKTYITIFL